MLIYGDEGLQNKKSSQNEHLIKRLEGENKQLKILLAEKELESKLKGEVIKKVSRVEKASLVSEYRCKGLKFGDCLRIINITRNQYYYNLKGA